MFNQRNFVSCIELQLEERGFGAKRKAEILDRFAGLTSTFEAQGWGGQVAQSMAMSRVFEDLSALTRDRHKAALKALEVVADTRERVLQGLDIDQSRFASAIVMDGGFGRGAALARGAIAMLMSDPRFSGTAVEELKFSYRGKYWSALTDTWDKFSKGAFGTQRGKDGLFDIVREIFEPGTTKNSDAAEAASSYLKLSRVMVDDRNRVGGALNFLDRYLPQRQNASKVVNTPFAKWRDEMNGWLDWDRMTWPDGSLIQPKDRDQVLKDVYHTFRTDGGSKVEPGSFNGRGSAVGSQLEDHRFLHYKDADSWIAAHETYGNGNVFDVIALSIESMAHKTALVQQFGRNPQMWLENTKAIITQEASKLVNNGTHKYDQMAKSQADAVIKNKLEPMFEAYTHANPVNPDSPLAAGVIATSNMLTAAKLGSVPLIAVLGDAHQTLATRWLNNLPLLDGMGTYFKGLTTGFKDAEKFAARSGYVFDNTVGATYTTERFSPVATHGPQISRRISDTMIRASGLTRHTDIARSTVQHEFMGLLRDSIETKWDDLPFTAMMERYGIDEGMWDAARKAITPWVPDPSNPHAEFFRPLDLLDTKLANKDDLYQRFFSMVNQESKYAVPGATLEAQVALKGTLRPDTLPGIIMHSFAMYKNFPITYVQMYGRMLLSEERTSSRIGFAAAMGVGGTLVGAMGVQLREISKGREPMPMDRWQFWGKAMLSGGGMGIWGDFLFNGVNEMGQGPANVIGGPLAGLAKDMSDMAFGDPFKWVQAHDKETEWEAKFPSKAVAFMKANTPGTSLWWARLALEREIWDALDELADPHVHRKQKAKERKQLKTYGNEYYSPPGSGITGQGPLLTR
jgi:hypothetical protein